MAFTANIYFSQFWNLTYSRARSHVWRKPSHGFIHSHLLTVFSYSGKEQGRSLDSLFIQPLIPLRELDCHDLFFSQRFYLQIPDLGSTFQHMNLGRINLHITIPLQWQISNQYPTKWSSKQGKSEKLSHAGGS